MVGAVIEEEVEKRRVRTGEMHWNNDDVETHLEAVAYQRMQQIVKTSEVDLNCKNTLC